MVRPSATATKMGLTIRETPQSISVVTRQQIDDLALTDLPQVLDRVPGITVGRNDSERLTFYSRGFEVENIQFDGVPNTVDAASQYTTTLADSAVYDRVEVVKGATGLLTGAGYPSATLNLVRKRPTREFRASAEVSGGSWDRYRGVADVSAPLAAGGKLRARVVAAVQNAGSYVNHYSRDTRNFYGIVEGDLGPRTTLSAGVDYMTTRARGSSFGHIPLFYSDGTRTNFDRSFNPAARWAYWNNESTNIFAQLKHEWGQDWKLDLSASHLRQTRDALFGSAYFGQIDKATGGGIRMLSGYIPNQATTNAVNLALTGGFELLGHRHELMLNGTFSRQTRASQLYGSIFTPIDNYFAWDGSIAQPAFTKTSDRDTRTNEKGLAGAIRLRPTDRLSVIGGARVSWYSLYDGSRAVGNGAVSVSDDLSIKGKVTPYAGVVYDVTPQWSLYGSYTDIFRPQTYYKYSNGAPLAPLTGQSLEAGIKGTVLEDRLNVSLALFRIRQNNYAQVDGGFTPQGDDPMSPSAASPARASSWNCQATSPKTGTSMAATPIAPRRCRPSPM
jgi:outer membrane receptor for ferric coprogen and ferric-rhodotorulic acid